MADPQQLTSAETQEAALAVATAAKGGTVVRIARRRAKPGCALAYEALVRAMIEDAQRFSGFVAGSLFAPPEEGGKYQVVMRFAAEAELQAWNQSTVRADWHEKLRAVAEGDPDYQMLTGLEAWFAPAIIPASAHPPRWRMTLVSWLGIYPTVSLLLWFIAPLLSGWPFLLRTALLTSLVAILMAFVVMPRLSRWMGWFLRAGK